MSLSPAFNTTIFSSAAFIGGNYLTKSQADGLYMPLSALSNLSYISGISPGTAYANKALVLDNTLSISGINSIGITTLTVGGSVLNSSNIGYLNGITEGIATASKPLILNSLLNITGINLISTTQISIGGSVLDITNASFLTGITAGVAQASKALVSDSSRNITNINNLSSTGLISISRNDSSTMISSSFVNNTSSLNTLQQWTNNLATPITAELDISNIGVSIGTLTNHPFRLLSNGQNRLWVAETGLVGINTNGPAYQLDVNGSFNATSINGGRTILSSNVSIGNTNNTYPLDISGTTMTTAFKIRQTGSGTTEAPNFTIDNTSSAGYSGLRIAPDATNLLNLSNIGFWNAGYSTLTAYIVNNANQNCVHMRPSNAADVSSPIPNVGLCCGNNAIIRGGLIVSSMPLSNSNNYVPTTKLKVIGDTNYLDGGYQKVAEFCTSTYGNTLSIQCSSTAGGPIYLGGLNGSDLRFGTSNSTSMMLTDTGHLLVGTTTDVAPFVVSGSSTYTVVPFATTTYRFNVATNTYSNLGGGPVSFSISAYFSSNIFVQNSIYTTSDRRLKDNIKPLDITLDHYNQLKPVSYKYKNESITKLGLIAQDCLSVCSEIVGYSENEKMKKETEDDIEGYQYTVDYSQLSVMNCSAIKKLIDRVKDLEAKLTSKPAPPLKKN